MDYRTAWVIAGLGHGHEDLANVQDPDVLLGRDGDTYRANAKLLQFNEITDENIDSFHFHGSPANYPITAIIALPHDEKAGALLRGRYVGAGEDGELQQILVPGDVIEGSGAPLTVPLGPGVLGHIFDGLLRPLDAQGDYIAPGTGETSQGPDWPFSPRVVVGKRLGPGQVVGLVRRAGRLPRAPQRFDEEAGQFDLPIVFTD